MNRARHAVRILRDERGMATLETAAAITILVAVTGLIVGTIATVATYIRLIDAAGAAARAHAIGEEFVPAAGNIRVHESGGVVEVEASSRAMFMRLSATARYPVEARS